MLAEDRQWMAHALRLAEQAAANDEVPVGAVLVHCGQLLAEGANAVISLCDPSAHAEMQALRFAALQQHNYRLPETTLYSTLEPCAMCAGTIVQARIKRVVYAADDPRAGAAGSVLEVLSCPPLNHHPQVEKGLLAAESTILLQRFFQQRRNATEAQPQSSAPVALAAESVTTVSYPPVSALLTRLTRHCDSQQLRIVTAESCSGGMLASWLTDLAGSSAWFERGFVCYSNQAKKEMLGVPEEILATCGAVSEETAKAMAQGALQHSDAQLAVAITGIAGPGGGSDAKPLGTVCFAWASQKQIKTTTRHFHGYQRQQVRRFSCVQALQELLRLLQNGAW